MAIESEWFRDGVAHVKSTGRVGVHVCAVLMRWVAALCVVSSLSACGVATFIVQQYDGQPLPNERIAILRVNGDSPVRLEELDGEVLSYELQDPGSRVHIEMLPGQHEIGLADGPGLPLKRRRFVAEAGKVYRPMVFHRTAESPSPTPGDGWVVAIYEVDRDSDAIIREISQVPLLATQDATVPPPAPVPSAPMQPSLTPSGRTTPPAPQAPSPHSPAPAPAASPDSAALPNTTSADAVSPGGPATAPSPIPPGVAPAKGPKPNPAPPGAEAL